MNLPSKDSAVARTFRTLLFATVGFLSGLAVAVWKVEGVPEVVQSYLFSNGPELLLLVGVPAALSTGGLSMLWNLYRKDVKNY